MSESAQKKRLIILDTETTGFEPSDGHRIVEVGCIELDENRKQTGRIFHEYVDPEMEVPEGAYRIHKNSRQDLIEQGNGQKFKDISLRLFDFIKGAELVIHHAAFDTKHLNAEFQRCGLPNVEEICSIFCSLKYASAKHPGKRVSLDALCKLYGVDNSGREVHGALLDSELLADVYVAMTREQKTLELTVNTKAQDVSKLVEKMPTVVSLPVVMVEDFEEAEHDLIMKRIAKESGGNSLWR
jgi:DNA polymerase-3 subunit epsilon